MANIHHMALTPHQTGQMFDYGADHERVAHGWRRGKPIDTVETQDVRVLSMIARSLAQVFEMARALGLRPGLAQEPASK